MNAREHDVRTSGGRTLRVVDAGDPGGPAIVTHHGTPGSHLLHPDAVQDATERGARIIGYDRPGYGGSDRDHGRTVADAAGDVAAIADALGVERFATWGLSGGSPHALACAALLGDRVAAVATLGTVAPYESPGLDWTAGMADENLEEFGLAAEGEAAVTPFVAGFAEQFAGLTPADVVEAFGDLLSPPDRAVLDEREAGLLLDGIREGVRERADGWVDDDLAFVASWGFGPEDVRIPALVWHGRQDTMAPIGHATWVGERIPGAEVRVGDDDGHLTIALRRIGEVHDWLLQRLR